MKAPSSNSQHPVNNQAPSSVSLAGGVHDLKFENWSFSGSWMLELGAFRKDHR